MNAAREMCTPCAHLLAMGTALALLGCDPGPVAFDAGSPFDGAAESGEVELVFSADFDEGEYVLDEAILELGMVRARSDRSTDEEPRWDELGRVVLEPPDPIVSPALPATYGGLVIAPSADAECQASLRVSGPEFNDVEVCLGALPTVDLRCETPSVLGVDQMMTLAPTLDLREILAALDGAGLEDDALVDTSHPLHDELAAGWSAAWSLECGAAETEL